MAVLAELGAPRLSAVLGVEHEQVSLSACNLLHVMFDSLKEGLQKEFRGKEDAVVLGECLLPWLLWDGEGALGRPRAAASSCPPDPGHCSCCRAGAQPRVHTKLSWKAGAPGHGSISCQPYHGGGEAHGSH